MEMHTAYSDKKFSLASFQLIDRLQLTRQHIISDTNEKINFASYKSLLTYA